MRWLKDSSPDYQKTIERDSHNMDEDIEFSIQKSTLDLLNHHKNSDGFGWGKWDEWFESVFNNKKMTKQETFEKVVQKFFYKNDYEQWIQNFALNLNDIWNENSAKILSPTKDYDLNSKENSAIVIGRGPALKKYKHLELLANSDFKGSIVCTDGALPHILESGVTPEKFPKFYVVTIDAYEGVIDFYNNKFVDKYGNKIKGVFSTLTHNKVVNRARKSGIKIHWLHTLFDYNEGKKSFNSISASIVRAKNHSNGLPAIQTGGNSGTSSWFVSWKILKCANIALIGINHGWEETDSLETIISHGNNINAPNIDVDSQLFTKLFPKIHNPEFNTNCILDPTFQFYSEALKEFISRAPSWVNTINATEGGSIFGENITCMTFQKFLESY